MGACFSEEHDPEKEAVWANTKRKAELKKRKAELTKRREKEPGVLITLKDRTDLRSEFEFEIYLWETVSEMRLRLYEETEEMVFYKTESNLHGDEESPPNPPATIGELSFGGMRMEDQTTFGEHDIQAQAMLFLSYSPPFKMNLEYEYEYEYETDQLNLRDQVWVWPEETMRDLYVRLTDFCLDKGLKNSRKETPQ